MILSVFPCTGKTSVASYKNGFIDLESSCFFVDGQRPDNWEEIYVNFAVDLSKQGYTVFISSHKLVRDCMTKRNIPFVSVFPSKYLKEFWKDKLEKRFKEDNSDKNRRAMEYVIKNYEQSIDDMSKDMITFRIENKDYKFENVISNSLLILERYLFMHRDNEVK